MVTTRNMTKAGLRASIANRTTEKREEKTAQKPRRKLIAMTAPPASSYFLPYRTPTRATKKSASVESDSDQDMDTSTHDDNVPIKKEETADSDFDQDTFTQDDSVTIKKEETDDSDSDQNTFTYDGSVTIKQEDSVTVKKEEADDEEDFKEPASKKDPRWKSNTASARRWRLHQAKLRVKAAKRKAERQTPEEAAREAAKWQVRGMEVANKQLLVSNGIQYCLIPSDYNVLYRTIFG